MGDIVDLNIEKIRRSQDRNDIYRAAELYDVDLNNAEVIDETTFIDFTQEHKPLPYYSRAVINSAAWTSLWLLEWSHQLMKMAEGIQRKHRTYDFTEVRYD